MAGEAAREYVDLKEVLAQAGVLRERKEFEPQHLRSVHMQMVALDVAGLGVNEIAEIVHYTPSRVSVILNSPEAEVLRDELTSRFVSELTQDTAELIQAHTREAFHNHLQIMRDTRVDKPHVSLQASRDIMYMGGFKPVERVINETLHMRAEDAAAIKAALEQHAVPPPKLEDIELTHTAFQAGVQQTRGSLPSAMPEEPPSSVTHAPDPAGGARHE